MRPFPSLLAGFLIALAGCKTTPPASFRAVPGAQASYPPPGHPVRVVAAGAFDRLPLLRDGYAITGTVTVYTLDRDEADRDAKLTSVAGEHGAAYVQVGRSWVPEEQWQGSGSGTGFRTSTSTTSYGNVTHTETTTTWSSAYASEPTRYTVYRSEGTVWCKDPQLAAQQLADRTTKDQLVQRSRDLHLAAMAKDHAKVRELIANGAVPDRLGAAHPDLDPALRARCSALGIPFDTQLRSAVTHAILRGDVVLLDLLLDGMQGRSWTMTGDRQEDDAGRPDAYSPQLEQGLCTAPFESWFDRAFAFAAILATDRDDLLQILRDHGMSASELLLCDNEATRSYSMEAQGVKVDAVARLRRFGASRILAQLARDTIFGNHLAETEKLGKPPWKPAVASGGIDAMTAALDAGDILELSRLLAIGTAVDGRDAAGRTPLTVAAQAKDAMALQLLLLHGAKPNALDGRGLSAMHVAVLTAREPYETWRMLRVLGAGGADANFPDANGYTPWQYSRTTRLTEYLLELGATPKASKPTYEQLLASLPPGTDLRPFWIRGWRSPTGTLVGALREVPSESDGSNLRVVEVNGLMGYQDERGAMVIEPRFRFAFAFAEGMAVARESLNAGDVPVQHAQPEYCGYIGADGDWVIPPQFRLARAFAEGLAFVQFTDTWGYTDRTGHWAIRPRFRETTFADSAFAEGLAAVWVPDASGQKVESMKFAGVTIDNPTIGYIDRTGAFVIPPAFRTASRFVGGLARVGIGSDVLHARYGFIDRTGAFVIPAQYGDCTDFAEGLAGVCFQGPPGVPDTARWGIIDVQGRVVVPATYERVAAFEAGVARVFKNKLWGLVDKTGRIVLEPQFAEIGHFRDGLATVLDRRGDKPRSGTVDPQGRVTWKP